MSLLINDIKKTIIGRRLSMFLINFQLEYRYFARNANYFIYRKLLCIYPKQWKI